MGQLIAELGTEPVSPPHRPGPRVGRDGHDTSRTSGGRPGGAEPGPARLRSRAAIARERASLFTPSRRRTAAGGLTQGWRKVSVLYLSANSAGSACGCPALGRLRYPPQGQRAFDELCLALDGPGPAFRPEEPSVRTGIKGSGTPDQSSGARTKPSGQTGWSEAATTRGLDQASATYLHRGTKGGVRI